MPCGSPITTASATPNRRQAPTENTYPAPSESGFTTMLV